MKKGQTHYFLFFTQLVLFFAILNFSCNKKNTTDAPNNFTDKFTINGTKIYHYNNAVQLIGADAFHIFSAGGSDMNKWNIDIAREFVGNVKEARLNGAVFQDANGAYLYSMQSVADSNRKNNRVTIFCAFGWDGKGTTEFTGKRPGQTTWSRPTGSFISRICELRCLCDASDRACRSPVTRLATSLPAKPGTWAGRSVSVSNSRLDLKDRQARPGPCYTPRGEV